MSLYGTAFGAALISAAGLATLITSFVTETDKALIGVSCVVVGAFVGLAIAVVGKRQQVDKR